MPKLHQYKDGSGYYIRSKILGTGKLITYKYVTNAALKYLTDLGYDTKIRYPGSLDFPYDTLAILFDKGLISTGKSGVTPAPPDIRVSHNPAPHSNTSAVVLAIQVTDQSWYLSLSFPELPDEWVRGVNDLLQAVVNCRISVSGHESFPATRLWPGKGSIAVSVVVPPQCEDYDIKLEGEWPPQWPVTSWVAPVAGLNKYGTFFDEESGTRVTADTSLEPGSAYFFIASTAQARVMEFPGSITYEALGVSDNWCAWKVHLPGDADDTVRTWCEYLGYHLAIPLRRVVLVGPPPHRYTSTRIPVIPVDQDVLVAILPRQSDTQTEAAFYYWHVENPGFYKVGQTIDSFIPLILSSEEIAIPDIQDLNTPDALSVSVQYKTQHTFHALRDGRGPHHVRLPSVCRVHPLDIEIIVNCLVPLDVICNGVAEHQVAAEDVPSLIQAALKDTLCNNTNLDISIDAGAFGALDLHISSGHTESGHTLPLNVQRRARWLSTVLPGAIRADAPSLPLSRSLRDVLVRLSDVPGCSALRMIHTVPPYLLPHLRAVMGQVLDNEFNHDM